MFCWWLLPEHLRSMGEGFFLRPLSETQLRVTLKVPVCGPGWVPEEAVQLGLDNEGLLLWPWGAGAGLHCGQCQGEHREQGQHTHGNMLSDENYRRFIGFIDKVTESNKCSLTAPLNFVCSFNSHIIAWKWMRYWDNVWTHNTFAIHQKREREREREQTTSISISILDT